MHDDDTDICIACEKPLKEGDAYYEDVNEGPMHAECCGPEPESFVDADGEPLKPGDPIPEPGVYRSVRRRDELMGRVPALPTQPRDG